jgi:hypothetical protein
MIQKMLKVKKHSVLLIISFSFKKALLVSSFVSMRTFLEVSEQWQKSLSTPCLLLSSFKFLFVNNFGLFGCYLTVDRLEDRFGLVADPLCLSIGY